MPPCPAYSAVPAAPAAASEPRSPAEPLRYDCLSNRWNNMQMLPNAFSWSSDISLDFFGHVRQCIGIEHTADIYAVIQTNLYPQILFRGVTGTSTEVTAMMLWQYFLSLLKKYKYFNMEHVPLRIVAQPPFLRGDSHFPANVMAALFVFLFSWSSVCWLIYVFFNTEK